jgi:Cu+-exporting ATPase
MALEPVVGSAEADPNQDLADMSRRFWIGLVLALPVFVLEMGGRFPALGLHDLVPMQTSIWLECASSAPVVLWAGAPSTSPCRQPRRRTAD